MIPEQIKFGIEAFWTWCVGSDTYIPIEYV